MRPLQPPTPRAVSGAASPRAKFSEIRLSAATRLPQLPTGAGRSVPKLQALERALPALPLPPARRDPGLALHSTPAPAIPAALLPPQPEPIPTAPSGSAAEITVRVQLWMASATPRMALELGGAWAGRLDVERTGPGRVRVSWKVRGAGRSAGLARRLHDALGAAGLTVEGLSVTESA